MRASALRLRRRCSSCVPVGADPESGAGRLRAGRGLSSGPSRQHTRILSRPGCVGSRPEVDAGVAVRLARPHWLPTVRRVILSP